MKQTLRVPKSSIVLKAQKPPNPAYPARLETIGDHLCTERLDEGKYLREVAKEIGVAKGTLHDWKLNKAKPIISFRILKKYK